MMNRFAILQLIKQLESSSDCENKQSIKLDKAHTLKRLLPVLKSLYTQMNDHNPLIIVFDGRCGSGKTTLANELGKLLGIKIIHMDDFYVPMLMKTSERLDQAGGNVHYERFQEEVVSKLSLKAPFSYRVFDCQKQCFSEIRRIDKAPVRIVEGSYSMHPSFGDYGHLYFFCDVDAEEQQKRLLNRNGAEKLIDFNTQWIPLEEHYFNHFDIAGKADCIL